MTPVVLPIAPEAMPEGGASETAHSGASEGSRFEASLAKALSHREVDAGRETEGRDAKENSPQGTPQISPTPLSPQNVDLPPELPRTPTLPPDFIPDAGEFPDGSEMNAYAFAPAPAETLPIPKPFPGDRVNTASAPIRLEIPGLPNGPLPASAQPGVVPAPGPGHPVIPNNPFTDPLSGPNPGPLPAFPPLDGGPGSDPLSGRVSPFAHSALASAGIDPNRFPGKVTGPMQGNLEFSFAGERPQAPAPGLPQSMPGAALGGVTGLEGTAFPASGIPGPSARAMKDALTAGFSSRPLQPEAGDARLNPASDLALETEPEAAVKPTSAFSGNSASGDRGDSGLFEWEADPRAGMARLEKPSSAPAAPPPFEPAPARTALTHLPSALLLHMVQSAARGGSLAVLGRDEIFVQLEPAHLGRVQVAMETQQGRVMARIGVENESVRQMVESQLPALRHSLEQQGVRVESLEVQVQDRQASLLNPEGQDAESFFQRRRPGGSHGEGGGSAEAESDALAGAETGRRWGFNTVEYIA